MKKISCIAIIATIMACPAFADIAANNNNPTCDNNTIGATSGDTALDATWTANTLNLKFMANGQQFASNTCTYGQNITIPTGTPTRTGYNFAGWQLRVSAPEPVQYTACSQITDQTTCNEYSDHGCMWDDYSGTCELGEWNYCFAPSESWCVDAGFTWSNNSCEGSNLPCSSQPSISMEEDTCTYYPHKDTCERYAPCVWNEQQQSCSDPNFVPLGI